MSKKVLAAIVLILVVVGAFLVLKNNETEKMSNNPVNSEPKTEAVASSSGQIVTESGLKIEEIKVGEGKEVKPGDTVTIHYAGTLENGKKFDSSYDRNEPFQTQIGVGQVIEGWDEGVVGMKVGGKRKLTIPSDLAYGERGAGGVIPPNATLIFELELLDVK